MISVFCDSSPTQADLSKQAGRTHEQLQECKKLLCKLSNCKLKEVSWELWQCGAADAASPSLVEDVVITKN